MQTAHERLSTVTQEQLIHDQATDFVKWLACCHTDGPLMGAQQFLQRWPGNPSGALIEKAVKNFSVKAAVAAGNTTDATWAAPLVTPAELAEAFQTLARSASLIARIPNLTTIPFNTRLPAESQSASFQWVGEAGHKPESKYAFATGATLAPLKAAGIVVTTKELGMVSVLGTESVLRDLLVRSLTAFTDTSFVAPTAVAVAGKQPGSITSTAGAPVTGTGDLRADVGTLLGAFFTANPHAASAVLILGPGEQARLMGPEGRTPYGLPTIVSGAAAGLVIAADPTRIVIADGGVAVETSDQALVQMDDAPVPVTSTTVLRSLWQHNERGFLVQRVLNWAVSPTTAVKYLAVS